MALRRIVIIGAGGFAREVEWLLREINSASPRYRFVGCVVSDLALAGEHDSRDLIVGDFEWLREHRGEVDAIAIGIGTPAARIKVAEKLQPDVADDEWVTLIHPSVRYDQASCKIGSGVILGAGVIGTVNVEIDDFAMVNLSCTLGHEARLGRGCVLNPTVNISGGVKIGEGALIGTGAQVLQYLSVGRGAVVGAGAVVTKDVADGVTVVGSPAKPLQNTR